MTSGAQDVRTSGVALGVALALHLAAAIAVSRVDANWGRTMDPPVEIEVNVPPPPKVEVKAEVPPPVPPPVVIPPPKLVARPVRAETARAAPPSPAPPPPNQAPPPTAPSNAPPVFGVTMSSVVSGEAAMAVPMGNTTMVKPQRRPTSAPPSPYAGSGTKAFVPVPDVYIKTRPRVLREVNSDAYYPPDAQAIGLEGTVQLSVGIDEKGRVVEARVIRAAGHGFDEKAAAALKETPFSPALTSDGRAVPCRITFNYKFEIVH